MTGVKETEPQVFKRFGKEVSIEEKIKLIVERHDNDFYRNKSIDQLKHVD
jgi:hypothetical protein